MKAGFWYWLKSYVKNLVLSNKQAQTQRYSNNCHKRQKKSNSLGSFYIFTENMSETIKIVDYCFSVDQFIDSPTSRFNSTHCCCTMSSWMGGNISLRLMLQQRDEKCLVKPWNFNIKTEEKTHILSSVHQVFSWPLWDDVGGYFWERLAAILLQRSLVRGDSQWETLGNGDNCASADQRNKKKKTVVTMLLYLLKCCF